MRDNNLKTVRCVLLDRIINGKISENKHEAIRAQIFNLLKQTVEGGESNSALLIGPRGVGKTSLINSILIKLAKLKNFNSNAVVVRLNGFTHTDDRLALKATTAQLELDNTVDGKVFGSFAENLSFLLACLREGNKSASKSVLFIIEEFDLFCAHHNQTLLYNLFDISQSAQAPICVLGITCRLDVIELLEKRVKSRFSHRQYFIFPGGDDDDRNELNDRIDNIEDMLTLNKHKDISSNFMKEWNSSIKELVDDKRFRTLMLRLLDLDVSDITLKNIMVSTLVKLNEDKEFLVYADFEEQLKNFEKDEVVESLQDLTVLEISLLISMKHHMEIYDCQPMNFEMIYTRYLKFCNSVSSSLQAVKRPIVMKAFEHLKCMELIQPISGTSGKLQKEYQMFKVILTPHQIMDAVRKYHGIPTEIAQWATSSIV